MNFIRPYFRPINSNQLRDWEIKYKKLRKKYENYIINMKDKLSEEQCNKIWNDNYGIVPPKKPNHFYKCEIINPYIKMIVTVIDNENVLNKKYRYEIVKFNKVILDTYDKNNILKKESDIFTLYVEDNTNNIKTYSKVSINKNDLFFRQGFNELINNDYFLLKQDDNTYSIASFEQLQSKNNNNTSSSILNIENIKFDINRATTSEIDVETNNINFKQSAEDIIKDKKYLILKYKNSEIKDNLAINYEDSNWFNLLSIQKFLDKLKIKLIPYNINEKDSILVPKIFIYSMDYMEILDFNIYDNIFKDNLNSLINNSFIKNMK